MLRRSAAAVAALALLLVAHQPAEPPPTPEVVLTDPLYDASWLGQSLTPMLNDPRSDLRALAVVHRGPVTELHLRVLDLDGEEPTGRTDGVDLQVWTRVGGCQVVIWAEDTAEGPFGRIRVCDDVLRMRVPVRLDHWSEAYVVELDMEAAAKLSERALERGDDAVGLRVWLSRADQTSIPMPAVPTHDPFWGIGCHCGYLDRAEDAEATFRF